MGKKKVLTVDDSKVVRSMVTRHLQGYDCEVVEATNGQEGIEAAKRTQPDLILLDITMPVMDGRQALAALRADASTKAIPVIMLTAESGRDLVVEIVKLGVAGYIVKPFQKEGFDKEVSKILGAPSADVAPPPPPVDRGAVLIVDDSEAVLDAARAALAASMTVLTAASAADGLERYREKRPGVVVMDVARDGDNTVGQMKALGASGFVALAAAGDAGAQESARRGGYHAVLHKPFAPHDLLDQVLVAVGSVVASSEELVSALLGRTGACAVLNLPDPRAKLFAKVLPAITKRVKALARDGLRGLVVDLGNVTQPSSDLVKSVVMVVSEAGTVGVKTAIAAPSAKVAEALKQIAETQNSLHPDREAARQSLQQS